MGESVLEPTSIAQSRGGKRSHSYEETLHLLGLRTIATEVKVPEVGGPEPRPWADGNGVEQLVSSSEPEQGDSS